LEDIRAEGGSERYLEPHDLDVWKRPHRGKNLKYRFL
jgi:hypothetical protein